MLQILARSGVGKIHHVVYIVQENRSFDDLFQGYPGAETVSSGKTSTGKTIKLAPVKLSVQYEIDHSADAMFAACDGTGVLPGTKCRMDGFDLERLYGGPPNGQDVYVPHVETKPYFDMAHEWVSVHHRGASRLERGCSEFFNYPTLGDELARAGLSWRFYTSSYKKQIAGFWSGYQAVKHILYGPDWKKDVLMPQKRFLKDVAAGQLAAFTWITPLCVNSDHLACVGGFGPSWVTALVNAIGTSKFWDTTAVFVQWDDWGEVSTA